MNSATTPNSKLRKTEARTSYAPLWPGGHLRRDTLESGAWTCLRFAGAGRVTSALQLVVTGVSVGLTPWTGGGVPLLPALQVSSPTRA